MKIRILGLTFLSFCTLCMSVSCSKDNFYGVMRMEIMEQTSGTLKVSFQATVPDANAGFFAAAAIGGSKDLENSYDRMLTRLAEPGTNAYEFLFTGLEAGKEYYVCAMMSMGMDKTTSWGKPLRVVMDDPVYPVPDEVDLGLSVKWSTFDLGASMTGTRGLYFQWGDIKGYGSGEHCFAWRDKNEKSSYKWYCVDSGSGEFGLTRYVINGDSNSGYRNFCDGKTSLDLEDDPGAVCVGSGWRMPSVSEWEELIDPAKCRWIWGTNEAGINGYTVSSKIEGFTDKSIFLPASGTMSGVSLQGLDSDGRYWTSQLSSGNSYSARSYSLSNRRPGEPESFTTTDDRYHGLSIRLVRDR